MFGAYINTFGQAYSKYDRKYLEVLIFFKRIAIDPIFPPPDISQWNGGKKETIPEKFLENNRYELIFDELSDGLELKSNTNKFLTGNYF